MKTRNFILFVLAAVVCGAFLCADSQAKVCFLGEECSYNVDWAKDDLVKDEMKEACNAAGYDKTSCSAGEFSYACPMKATYKRCCPSNYRYEACIYPTEVKEDLGDVFGDGVGKCGTRYACRCPAHYNVTTDYADDYNCRPSGGYCMLNDGESDDIKYETCTCDPNVFIETPNSNGGCPNNQSIRESCTGKRYTNETTKTKESYTMLDCYCKRGSVASDGYSSKNPDEFPFSECMYGKVIGSKECVDSDSKRTYYQKCRSAEQACKDDGYEYTSCSSKKNCTTKSTVYWNGSNQYLTSKNCILGKMCPYPTSPSLYECVFDKASWCNEKGYTKSSSTAVRSGDTCTTDDGYTGKYDVCPANDGAALYYFRCKLPCEQEVRRAYSKGYLTQDTSMTGDDGQVVGYVRTDASNNKHIYFIGNITLPKANMGTKNGGWANIGNSVNYSTINGMWALEDTKMKYPDGSYMFEGCAEERAKTNSYSSRPRIRFDGLTISKTNRFLNKNMSDIRIDIYSSDASQQAGYGETYEVASAVTWHNVTLSSSNAPNSLCILEGTTSSIWYPARDDCKNDWHANWLLINGTTVTFTGTPYFAMGWAYYGEDKFHDHYAGFEYPITWTNIVVTNGAKVVFNNATIKSNYYTDWYGYDGKAAMLFYNSTGSMGRVWSTWNTGMTYSDISFDTYRASAYASADNTFGVGVGDWNHARYRCHGIYAYGSKVRFSEYAKLQGNYFKLYLENSDLIASSPIFFPGKNSDMICVDANSTATVNGVKKTGKGVWYGFNEANWYAGGGSGTPDGLYYKSDNEWNYNGYASCSGDKCKHCSYTNGQCLSSGRICDSSDGHNHAFYPSWASGSSSILCTACSACYQYGMGY